MIRIVTLDPKTTDPPYPYTEWNDKSISKWLLNERRISPTEPHKRTDNPDGTITFQQDQGVPAIRIFKSP